MEVMAEAIENFTAPKNICSWSGWLSGVPGALGTEVL